VAIRLSSHRDPRKLLVAGVSSWPGPQFRGCAEQRSLDLPAAGSANEPIAKLNNSP